MSSTNIIDRVVQFVGNVPRLAGRGLITIYRYTLSPLIGYECRHLPTCSQYGDEAIGRFGLWAGGWMTLGRLCRCHPLGTRGLDFVPHKIPLRARWYLPWRYARWRGMQLEPYGKDAAGASAECFACHGIAKGQDYVFTRPATMPAAPR